MYTISNLHPWAADSSLAANFSIGCADWQMGAAFYHRDQGRLARIGGTRVYIEAEQFFSTIKISLMKQMFTLIFISMWSNFMVWSWHRWSWVTESCFQVVIHEGSFWVKFLAYFAESFPLWIEFSQLMWCHQVILAERTGMHSQEFGHFSLYITSYLGWTIQDQRHSLLPSEAVHHISAWFPWTLASIVHVQSVCHMVCVNE